MGKIRTISLTQAQRDELVEGYRQSASHAFSKRCHIILLKSDRRSSKDVADIVGMHQVSVNNWLSRYEGEGLQGLRTRPGRGRKPILHPHKDSDRIREVVQQERQRLRQAKVLLEQELDKAFSLKTLKRFLKNISADINAFD